MQTRYSFGFYRELRRVIADLICVVCQVVLETEITNTGAMKLYERLGFLRSKRLHRYYLNGNSAYRLVLYLREAAGSIRNGADIYGQPHIGPVDPSSAAVGATQRDGGN